MDQEVEGPVPVFVVFREEGHRDLVIDATDVEGQGKEPVDQHGRRICRAEGQELLIDGLVVEEKDHQEHIACRENGMEGAFGNRIVVECQADAGKDEGKKEADEGEEEDPKMEGASFPRTDVEKEGTEKLFQKARKGNDEMHAIRGPDGLGYPQHV